MTTPYIPRRSRRSGVPLALVAVSVFFLAAVASLLALPGLAPVRSLAFAALGSTPTSKGSAGCALLIDTSSSVALTPSYQKLAADTVMNCIGFGSQVELLMVGASGTTTYDHFEIPLESGDRVDFEKAHKALKEARPRVEQFVASAASGERATATRLVDALRRLPQMKGLRVAVFSDGMEASADTVNLEQTRITEKSLPALVASATKGFQQNRLAGAQIQFILPTTSNTASSHPVLNDRATLEKFWTGFLVAAAPTASLTNFETAPRNWR